MKPFLLLLSLVFLQVIFPKEAKSACKSWEDKYGTEHQYCERSWGTEYNGRFRNGTRVEIECRKIGSRTECEYKTNGIRVKECIFYRKSHPYYREFPDGDCRNR